MSRQLTALAGRLGWAAPPSASSSPSLLVTRLLSNSVHQAVRVESGSELPGWTNHRVFDYARTPHTPNSQGKGSKQPKPNAKWGQNRKQHQPAAAVAADAAAGAQQGADLAEAQGNLGVLLNGRGAGEARDRWRPAHAGPSSDRQQEHQAGAAKGKGKGKGGGAAQFRQHQAQAAQRGQSVLGSSGVGAGAGPKMDVATFQRFSNIQERLDRARSNGQGQGQGASQYPANGNQQQQQQQHRRNGKRQHQQPQQQQGGRNGAGGASAAAAFAPLPAVNGAAAARSRWARIEGAPGAPAAAAGVSVQARLWEAEEEEQEQEAPSQQLQAQQRRERRAAGQQQQQQLQQQLQQQQASKKRKGPRLDRRLRLLTRVPLVLPHEPITVRELSQRLAMKMKDVGKRLVRLGGREEYGGLSPDSLVDLDVAELLGLELGRTVKRTEPAEDLLEYKSRCVACGGVGRSIDHIPTAHDYEGSPRPTAHRFY